MATVNTGDNQNKLNTIDFVQLKEWIKEQPLIPEMSDEKLKMFMHSCYYNVHDTKECLNAYYSLRIKSPEIFTSRNLDAPEMVRVSNIVYVGLLPESTAEGYRVIIIGHLHSDTSEYVFKDVVKSTLAIMDTVLTHIGLPPGIVVIMDVSNFTFSHLRKADMSTLKKIVAYFQDALPVRLKKMLLLSVPTPVNILMNILQPFMNDRMNSLIMKYPPGNAEYMNVVPRSLLPEEYGGEYKTIKEIQNETYDIVKEKKNWLKEEDELIEELAKKKSMGQKSKSGFLGMRF